MDNELYKLLIFIFKQKYELHLEGSSHEMLVEFYQLENLTKKIISLWGADIFAETNIDDLVLMDSYIGIDIIKLIEFCGYDEENAKEFINELRDMEN